MSVADSISSWTWVARIRRPQGRRGEVFAELLTDFPEKFADRQRLWLLPGDATAPPQGSRAPSRPASLPVQVELVAHWLHKGGIVLHFAGVDSISQAEELAGRIVAIPETERVPLGKDEVYVSDLIGCTVVDLAPPEPHDLGIIEDVDRTAGPVPLLVVRGPAGELLIPFAKSYLIQIDLEERRVEMKLPEGLAELNAPAT